MNGSGNALRLLFAFPLILAQSACSASPPEPQTLVDHELWSEVLAESDPFDDRPAEVECSPLAYGYDYIGEHSFEVEMGACDYLTVSQPSLAAVEVGDELSLRLWHNALVGPDGESHIAVMLAGQLVWDLRITIPGESGLLSDTFPSDLAAPVGAEVLYHLHNHGSNTYNFIEFDATGL